MVFEDDSAVIRLRFSNEEGESSLPDFGTLKKLDKVRCVLDGHLEVLLRYVHQGSINSSSHKGRTVEYSFNEIAQVKGSMNPLPAAEIKMEGKIARSSLIHTNLEETITQECSLEGVVRNQWRRHGFGGDLSPYRYKITQEDDDIDFTVQLLNGFESPSPESDELFWSALILTFVWINGGHPYVYYRSWERDGELVESVIQPLQKNPVCKGRLLSSHNDGSQVSEVMNAGIEFFRNPSPLATDLRLFLWQYRDTTAAETITLSMLLQACSLLEGVIGLVLRHSMNLSENQINSLNFISSIDNKTKRGAEARFYHAVIFLGIDWDNEFKPVYDTWKQVRNALAHGNLGEFWNGMGHPVLSSYPRIIQAFNVVVLKIIGYKGRTVLNTGWFAIPQ